MKKAIKIVALSLALCLLGLLFYLATQKPTVWWDTEWAGIALTKGGYRSWHMRFCEGRAYIDGKWVPAVVENGKLRKGHYRIPRLAHCDTRVYWDYRNDPAYKDR